MELHKGKDERTRRMRFPAFNEFELGKLTGSLAEFKQLIEDYRAIYRSLLKIRDTVDKYDRQDYQNQMEELDGLGIMVEEIKENFVDFP